MKTKSDINNLLYILSLLFTIQKSKAKFKSNDFLTRKNSQNNAQINNAINAANQNKDCLVLSLILNSFSIDFGWKDNNQCCMYERITCVDENGKNTAITTQNTIITELYFNDVPLNNFLPNAICGLGNLKVLQFVNNEGLIGEIPKCFGSMTQLEKIVFSNNKISGEIPKSFSTLQQLKYLSIEKTNVQNNIPEEICDIPSLTDLYINNNPAIKGPIPQNLNKLSNLKVVSFSDTNIEGTIPENIGTITTLKNISLQNTNLQGKIPDSIGSLTNLEIIKLHNTNLSGPLPSSFKNLTKLKILTLNNTSLEGPIPKEFESISFKECSFEKSNLCISEESTAKKEKNIPTYISSLPTCNTTTSTPPLKKQNGNDEGSSNTFLIFTLSFFGILITLFISCIFYRKYKRGKRVINFYKSSDHMTMSKYRIFFYYSIILLFYYYIII